MPLVAQLSTAYLLFIRSVNKIGRSNDMPDEAYANLKKAAAVFELEVAAGFGLRGLAAAADDARVEVLDYYLSTTVWTFELAFD